jgi:hypothetical protein
MFMETLFLVAFTLLAFVTTLAISMTSYADPLATALCLIGIAADYTLVLAIEHVCFRLMSRKRHGEKVEDDN